MVPIKQCKSCGETYPATAQYFPPRNDGSLGALRPQCWDCRRRSQRDNHANNPHLVRHQNLRYAYNNSLSDAQLMQIERGPCDCCGTIDPGGKGVFEVDHDHECCPTRPICGQCVRGIVCHRCNILMPALEHDFAKMARTYLAKHVKALRAPPGP
jgi:hypothetical protein